MLAKSVYEGVKQRMGQLQTDVHEREKRLAALQSQLEALALEHESALKQLQLKQQVRMYWYPDLLHTSLLADCGNILSLNRLGEWCCLLRVTAVHAGDSVQGTQGGR